MLFGKMNSRRSWLVFLFLFFAVPAANSSDLGFEVWKGFVTNQVKPFLEEKTGYPLEVAFYQDTSAQNHKSSASALLVQRDLGFQFFLESSAVFHSDPNREDSASLNLIYEKMAEELRAVYGSNDNVTRSGRQTLFVIIEENEKKLQEKVEAREALTSGIIFGATISGVLSGFALGVGSFLPSEPASLLRMAFGGTVFVLLANGFKFWRDSKAIKGQIDILKNRLEFCRLLLTG